MKITKFVTAGVLGLGLLVSGTVVATPAGATIPAAEYKVNVQNTAVRFDKAGIGHFGEKTYQYELGYSNPHVFGWYWVWTNTTASGKILNRDYANYVAYAKKGKVLETNRTTKGFRILALLAHDCFEAVESYQGGKGYIVEVHDDQARCGDATFVANPVAVAVRSTVFGSTLSSPVVAATPAKLNPLHTQYAWWKNQMYTNGHPCSLDITAGLYSQSAVELQQIVNDCSNGTISAPPPSQLLSDQRVQKAYQDYQSMAQDEVHVAQVALDTSTADESLESTASNDRSAWYADMDALDHVYGA